MKLWSYVSKSNLLQPILLTLGFNGAIYGLLQYTGEQGRKHELFKKSMQIMAQNEILSDITLLQQPLIPDGTYISVQSDVNSCKLSLPMKSASGETFWIHIFGKQMDKVSPWNVLSISVDLADKQRFVIYQNNDTSSTNEEVDVPKITPAPNFEFRQNMASQLDTVLSKVSSSSSNSESSSSSSLITSSSSQLSAHFKPTTIPARDFDLHERAQSFKNIPWYVAAASVLYVGLVSVTPSARIQRSPIASAICKKIAYHPFVIEKAGGSFSILPFQKPSVFISKVDGKLQPDFFNLLVLANGRAGSATVSVNGLRDIDFNASSSSSSSTTTTTTTSSTSSSSSVAPSSAPSSTSSSSKSSQSLQYFDVVEDSSSPPTRWIITHCHVDTKTHSKVPFVL